MSLLEPLNLISLVNLDIEVNQFKNLLVDEVLARLLASVFLLVFLLLVLKVESCRQFVL